MDVCRLHCHDRFCTILYYPNSGKDGEFLRPLYSSETLTWRGDWAGHRPSRGLCCLSYILYIFFFVTISLYFGSFTSYIQIYRISSKDFPCLDAKDLRKSHRIIEKKYVYLQDSSNMYMSARNWRFKKGHLFHPHPFCIYVFIMLTLIWWFDENLHVDKLFCFDLPI